MINLTRLLCSTQQPADWLRYGRGHGAPSSASARRPVVVWNITRRCNLRCLHCYSDSDNRRYPGELDESECMAVIEDLAAFGVPALLLSGGEPILHPLFFRIAGAASDAGLRITVSTNGTLIDRPVADRLKNLNIAYVGISLDGIGEDHDRFRGREGAFDRTVQGFRNCREAGVKSGLRLTLTPHTISNLDGILDFIEREDIRRVCFYHLVYSGRGAEMSDLDAPAVRCAIDKIHDRILDWGARGIDREVLTVGQPADGAYLWMKLRERERAKADEILKLLRWNGGGKSGPGTGIGNIDTRGDVHPDQFWQDCTLGNVRQKPFSQIWQESDHPTLRAIRSGEPPSGRCSRCRFYEICGGGLRVRAWQKHGDPMAEDPGCYLREEELEGSLS